MHWINQHIYKLHQLSYNCLIPFTPAKEHSFSGNRPLTSK